MYEFLASNIRRGWAFVRKNPQIAYTFAVGAVIIGSFVLVAQLFVSITFDTQDRFERYRLSTMQDAFVEFAAHEMNNAKLLNDVVASLMDQNATLTELKVIGKDARGESIVVASDDSSEIGIADTVPENDIAIQFANSDTSSSFTMAEAENGERYFRVARAITNEKGDVLGWFIARAALSEFDALVERSVRQAYLILALIIVVILYLIFRHARIIDYATLYRRLKELDQMKDDFISMASHELRSPLAAIRGYIEFIQESKTAKGNEENIARIQGAIDHLDSLIEDILDVSRLEQGRMKFEMTNVVVDAVVAEVAGTLKPLARKKRLEFKVEAGDVDAIRADVDRLRQIVTNLASNAIKYTREGEVKIRTYTEGDRVVIRVSDTGIGLSEEEQRNLFQKFYRVRSSETADVRGTGLGLWITKQLVDNMGGRISVESIKGVGSHFIVSFLMEKS